MKLKPILIILGMAMFIMSCTTTKVVFPTPLQTSSQNFSTDNEHIVIEVKFNRPIDQSTVIVGKTFILETEKDPSATGTLAWSADGKTVKFRTTKTVGDLLIYDPDGYFTLKLIGTDSGNGAIKDTNGRKLDGDGDGTYEGNYRTTFVHIG